MFTIHQLAHFLIKELEKDLTKYKSKLLVITGDFFLSDSHKNIHIWTDFKIKTIQNKEISLGIINLLKENKDNYNDLINILENIDFSKYIRDVAYILNCSYEYKYKEPIFITGENIISIEIVRYEPWSNISIQIGNENIVLPKTFNVIDTPIVEDLTAD